MIYLDTSFLLPIYTPEPQSGVVHTYLARGAPVLFFTSFHRLELRTALRARLFRKTLTRQELQTALRLSEEDLAGGILRHTPLLWADAFREAERLGDAHAAETGARSGDLLHVASALVLDAKEFLTFDQRQKMLARRAGLKVKP